MGNWRSWEDFATTLLRMEAGSGFAGRAGWEDWARWRGNALQSYTTLADVNGETFNFLIEG